MSKILLVEDDNNLREIYEARLQAEGYDIVAARDGEEALAVAMKERPDLIISDVMMPKISGFDMLDIIRSTEETKDVKVIMMTALSQAEDKERASKLGADRYLVKSQVTLEDVAKVAREVLDGTSSKPHTQPVPDPVVDTQPAASATTTSPSPDPIPTVATPAPIAVPVATQTTDPASSQDQAMAAVGQTATSADDAQALSQTTDQEQADINAKIDSFIDSSKPAQSAATSDDNQQSAPPLVHQPPATDDTTDESQAELERTVAGKKVIQPLNDLTASKGPDLHKLLEKEQEKDQMSAIAHDIAAKSTTASSSNNQANQHNSPNTTDTTEEATAQEALRQAAENRSDTATNGSHESQPPIQSSPSVEHAPEVAISEEGNLHLANAEQGTATPAPAEATSQEAAPPQSQMPNIPHTNGTSIDGVSSPSSLEQQSNQTPTRPQVPPTDQSATEDPNDIAL